MAQEFVARNGIIANNNSQVIGALTANTLIKSGGTSTQYLMADGSVTTVSGSSLITGAGITNTLPIWTSPSALGNSNISQNANAVLVGSAVNTTNIKFQVADGGVGTVTSTFTVGPSDPAFRLGFANGTGSGGGSEQGALSFNYSTASIGRIGFIRGISDTSCIAMTFGMGFAGDEAPEKMRLTLSGNVLVNTTTDNLSDKLQVNGSALVNKFKYIRATSFSGDLNTLTDAGFYETTLTPTNAPTSGFYYVTVERYSSDALWVHQTATSFGSANIGNRVYTRTREGTNGWQGWYEVMTNNITANTSNAILNQTAIVQPAAFNVSGNSKIAGASIGIGSGYDPYSVAFGGSGGFTALLNNSAGTQNTAIGSASLTANINGIYNTGLGFGSLFSTTGSSQNTGIGWNSFVNLTGGGGNVAIGSESGKYLNSLVNLVNSDSSIFLGTRTTALGQGQSNQTVIGYQANGLGSNSVVLGNDSVTKTALKGNVLINTTTDDGTSKLQVNGAGYFAGHIRTTGPIGTALASNITISQANSDESQISAFGPDVPNKGILKFILYGSTGVPLESMRLNKSGNVLIGTTSDVGGLYKLQVSGRIWSNDGYLINGNQNNGSATYIQFANNNGLVGIIGSDGAIFGGFSGDFGSYVYGSGDYFISTSAAKALVVKGVTRNVLINTTGDNGVDKLQVNGSLIANVIKKSGGTSNQFLMADGSVTTGGGGTIGGSGTVNFISKFSSTTALTNSQIFESGTNILIGTTTDNGLGDRLQINGSTNISTNFSVGLTTNNNGTRMVLNGSFGRNFQVANNWNVGDAFEITPSTTNSGTTFTTPAFVIKGTTGNIGIGTTTPNAKLSLGSLVSSVNGSVDTLSLYESGNVKYGLTVNNNGFLDISANQAPGGGGIRFFGGTDNTSPTERIRLNNTGNLLINSLADNAVDKLQVNGSVQSTAYKVNGGTSSQFLKADGSLDSTTYANNANVLHTTGTETKNGRLIISSPLNQALVATSPNAEGVLSMTDSAFSPAFIAQNNGGGDIANFNAEFGSVVARINYSGQVTAQAFIKEGGSSNQFLMADGSVTTGGSGGIGGSGTANFVTKFSSSTDITNSAIYDLGVNNVIGIGTTTPRNVSSYANLTIDGVPGSTLHLRINNTDGGGLRYDTGGLGVRTVTTTPVTFEVNSSERGRFATSGNFLIGTTTDNATDKLQVNGSVLASATIKGTSTTNVFGTTTSFYATTGGDTNKWNGITFQGVSISDMYLGRTPASVDDLVIHSASGELVRFKRTGNVGIGSTNPIEKLHVSGAAGTQVNVDASDTVARLHLSIAGSSKARIQYDTSNNAMLVGTNVASPLIFITDNSLRGRVTAGGTGRLLWNTAVDNGIDLVQLNGSLIATAIKKTGGLSTEYLMADGSVSTGTGTDPNALHQTGDESWTGIKSSTVTSSAALNLTNNGTVQGVLSVTSNSTGYGIYANTVGNGIGIQAVNNSGLGSAINCQNNSSGGYGMSLTNSTGSYGLIVFNNSNGIGSAVSNGSTGTGFRVDNTAGGTGMYLNNTTTNTGFKIDNTSSANGVLMTNNGSGVGFNILNPSSSHGMSITNNGTGTGLSVSNSTPSGAAIQVTNTAGSYGIYSQNNSTGPGIQMNNGISATGPSITYAKNGTTKATLNDAGSWTAQGYVHQGTASSSAGGGVLKADGTKTTNSSSLVVLADGSATAFVNVRGYDVMSGMLIQVGTTVTFNMYENTIGGTISWSRIGAGNYNGTLSAAFTSSKTLLNISNMNSSNWGFIALEWVDVNTIKLATRNSSSTLSDGVAANCFVEIRVYP